MKILFVSQRFVLPMDTGGKIRTGKILEQLNRHHEVTLVSNVEYAKDGELIEGTRSLCRTFVPVEWSETPRHTLRYFIRLIVQLFSRHPVTVLNTCSKRLRAEVEQHCATGAFDVAICDFVQCGLLFERVTSVPVVLFQHNVESEIAKRHMELSQNRFARAFWWLQWRRMLAYEEHYCRRFDHLIAVSERDKRMFAELYGVGRVTAIPTGVDTTYYSPQQGTIRKTKHLVFCGSMDWLPNEEGMLWFVRDILPLIRERTPDVELVIVGRRPSPSLRKTISGVRGVTLTGWVEDTRPYLAEAAIFIVPLRIGGGTRMKIFEAMAMARPVVSTSVGAEGLPITPGVHCYIEDNADDFALRVTSLLGDQDERQRIGECARKYVETHFSWERVSVEFASACKAATRNAPEPLTGPGQVQQG